MKRAFKVTEQMLEVVDDYSSHGSTPDEARKGLKSFFPKMTKAQIDTVLRRWRKEMNDSRI